MTPALHPSGPFGGFAPLLLVCPPAGARFVRLRRPVPIACIVLCILIVQDLAGRSPGPLRVSAFAPTTLARA